MRAIIMQRVFAIVVAEAVWQALRETETTETQSVVLRRRRIS